MLYLNCAQFIPIFSHAFSNCRFHMWLRNKVSVNRGLFRLENRSDLVSLKMRKKFEQEMARYGWLGRLRSDNLKGQLAWQLIGRDRPVAHNVDRAIDRIALTPGHGWCIGPNRAFPALVYHLHSRVRVYLLSLSAYVPDACWPVLLHLNALL